MQLPWGDSHPPLLLGLHLLSLDFTSEMNESLIKDAFLNPDLIHSQRHFLQNKLLTCCPSLPLSLAIHFPALCIPTLHLCLCHHLCLCLHLLFYQNYSPTMQYNWLESETQCILMPSVLNSLRDHLWFNWLKDTETWSWNVMLQITYLSSLPLLPVHHPSYTSPPPPSPPLLPSPL